MDNNDKNDKLFRKSALDRISSPEQLNEYIKVAGPGVWCILAALAVTFAAFFVWGVMGSIPETAEVRGTALDPAGRPLAVYCYLPIDETRQLEVGMDVRVSPDYAPKEEYGYIYGAIRSISQGPVSPEDVKISLQEDFELVVLPSGNVIEVVVDLEERDGQLRWSRPDGASVNVTVGSTCVLTVITAERKPIELMFRN